MQKAQNVINFFLLYTAIIFSSSCLSQQKILGVYSVLHPLQEHYSRFEFKQNGIFEYHSGASLGDSEFGKGYYTVKNDTLTLKYHLTKLKENSYHKIKYYKNSKDSIRIELKVFNLNLKPLSRISIIGNLKNHYGVETDDNGIAVLRFKKQKVKRDISVSNLCCGVYSFDVKGEFNYFIEVYLNMRLHNPIAIKEEIIKFKMVEATIDYIKLKNKDGKTVTWTKQKE